MEYQRSEIRAGAFLLTAFVVLTVMVFTVSDLESIFRKKREVRVLFSYSDGIEKNAPVRYSGTKVGKVKEVRVASEYGDKVEVRLSVYQRTVVKEDTRAAIKTLGIVGGKYVELSAGSPNARPLADDAVIMGEESLKLEDLTKIGHSVALKLKSIADNLDSMLGDPAIARSLKATVRNLEEVTGNVKVMTGNKEEVAAGLKRLPDLITKLDESAASLKTLLDKSDKLVGENRKNVDATLENIQEMTKNLKDATEDVKKHPWKLLRKP
ncbi:MAG: hypothetical protein A2X56_00500 [Nitrospirae bacterium GWC2_57_13]|nr:MAG: hypothetical protein A2X56_00500 [Nitrospirae bacterium GWC2_57_13]OGW40791.1 MAG: hypothetical protein A2X57_05035 [Nitrospirae bacterium GWD2_57_8]